MNWITIDHEDAVHIIPDVEPAHVHSDCWCDPVIEQHDKPLHIHSIQN